MVKKNDMKFKFELLFVYFFVGMNVDWWKWFM